MTPSKRTELHRLARQVGAAPGNFSHDRARDAVKELALAEDYATFDQLIAALYPGGVVDGKRFDAMCDGWDLAAMEREAEAEMSMADAKRAAWA